MSDPGPLEAPAAPAEGMTVKLKSGEEGLKKPNKREAEEEEEEAAGEVEEPAPKEGEPLIPSTPQQEALTPKGPQDQHHFLRSSVRPHSKRQRRDSCSNGKATATNAAATTTTAAKSKGLDNATPSSPSCSTGATPSATKTSNRNTAPTAGEKDEGNKKKVRRQWESWSTEDKNTFFEALYEHGKDFEAIQNNIALKYKKKAKPVSMVKNKEQVRHFYYRTWHKISKYIDFNNVFSCGLKKSSQELYGLICYGELRKKIGGCMDDKNAAKLNELIQLGATTVRFKGRNLRIKAPMCRALKKLCDPEGKTGLSDEEDQKPVRLPLKVPVELQPRSNQAWARVQSLAQNPRLRMIVELHRKVSSLIEFLKQKWSLQEVRVRKSLEDPQLAEVEDSKEDLCLFPPELAQLSSLPGVARVVHSKAYCTVHWQESGKCKQSSKDILLPPAQILGIQTGQGTARVQLKCPRGSTDTKQANKMETTSSATADRTPTIENGPGENIASEGVPDGPKTPDEAPPENMDMPVNPDTPCEVSSSELPFVDELSINDPFPRYLKSCQDLIVPEGSPSTANAVLSPPISPSTNPKSSDQAASPSQEKADVQTANPQQENCTTQPSGTTDSQVKEQSGSSKAPKDNSNQLTEQLRQEGWNQRTSENLTLAEVYLMLGKPGKLQLEYEWMDPNNSDDPECPLRHKQRLLNCLLRLIATEANPKTSSQTPETSSVATSIMKQPVQEQTLTPPGKVITLLSRNPDCLRTQPAQIHTTFSPPSNTSGFRNLSRPLVFSGPLGSVTTSCDGAVFAVPTMLPPNSRHTKISSPSKETEATGRQQLDTISPDFFLPKAKKPRSRHLRKPLVVQRTLLPRPSGSSLPHVCSFSILSNSTVAGRGSFRPIHSTLGKAISQPIVPKGLTASTSNNNSLSSAIDLAAKSAGIIPGPSLPVLETDGLVGIGPLPSDGLTGTEPNVEGTSSDPVSSVTVCPEVPFIALTTPPVQESAQPFQPSSILSIPHISQSPLENGPAESSSCTPSSSCLSPPNVSSLLDISLPGPPDDVLSHGEPATHISDSIIEIAISSGQYGEAVPMSPAKLGENSKSLPSPLSSPQQNWIASPSHDPQWYPNDSTDSSLSSLFSSFISPDKSKKMAPTATGNASGTSLLGPSLLDGSSRDSFVSRSLSDVEVVDSHLACLMNENSIDYISRFNDLAQELSATDAVRRETLFEAGTTGNEQPIRDLS
ncbi:protein cramped-like isoform X1 [Rana temporaria]|uniref:protein cramped-like isoform X1 n=2 Tax=Rana temporaria TaxID=8407 RepID=UPI001AADBE3C|nr:protein cramped-like isoform X1 [Rana temporaria]